MTGSVVLRRRKITTLCCCCCCCRDRETISVNCRRLSLHTYRRNLTSSLHTPCGRHDDATCTEKRAVLRKSDENIVIKRTSIIVVRYAAFPRDRGLSAFLLHSRDARRVVPFFSEHETIYAISFFIFFIRTRSTPNGNDSLFVGTAGRQIKLRTTRQRR